MNLQECYRAAGGDYEDVIRRFMNEERVDRFLSMFLRDPSFDALCCAMDQGSYGEAFRAVHTMKGICMNLGLSSLLEACAALTENLRSGTPDGDTETCLLRVKENYAQTAGAIRAHLE